MKLIVALLVSFAGAAPLAAQVTVESRQITEGSKAEFTIQVTYDPGKEVALAYFTEEVGAFDVPSGTALQKVSDPAARKDVGRIFRANVRVFHKDVAEEMALYESAKTKIPELIKTRNGKIATLQGLTVQVLAVDDGALAELAKGRKSAAGLIEKGEAEADKKAEAAMVKAWKDAKAKWAAAANVIAKWKGVREEIRGIDDQLNGALGLGPWPDPCAEGGGSSEEGTGDEQRLLAVVATEKEAPWVTAVELRFLADEYATSVGNLSLEHEIVLARPNCTWKLVRAESAIPAEVSVAKGNAEDTLGIGAEIARLLFTPGAAASADPHAVAIELHADAEAKIAASLPGANVDFTFDALLREPDKDVSKKDFSYDDPRSRAQEKCLVVYVRGSLLPAVTRYAAFFYLRNGTYFEVSALEDSHEDAPKFVALSWRRIFESDPKKGTIEFALRHKKAPTKDTSLKVADYAAGRFLFAFAYRGLPSVNSHFGVEKEMKMFRRNGTQVGETRILRPFFNVAKNTHPVVDTLTGTARNRAAAATNYLYYYSDDAKGTSAAAVSGLSFVSNPVNGKTVTVYAGGKNATTPGMMGLTEQAGGGYDITFFSTKLVELWQSGDDGLKYSYDRTLTLEFYNSDPSGAKWVKEPRTLTLDVHRKFVHLVAHVWRHELRHVEQFEGLAGLGTDARDEDKDRVPADQESANNTSHNDADSWPDFPISRSSQKGDNEIDCELRATGVSGTEAADWGAVFNGEKKPGKGTQWQE